MHELQALRELAHAMGVLTEFTDGLGRHVVVEAETLVLVCAAAGADIARPSHAADALRSRRIEEESVVVPRVIVAWDGRLPHIAVKHDGTMHGQIVLDDRGVIELDGVESGFRLNDVLPFGYHELTIDLGSTRVSSTVISAPVTAWRRTGSHKSWGLAGQLAALRSSRSRSFGDLRDLESACDWVRASGGDLMMLLPLLPTFNSSPAEPSPYSPVSRLFWSELILDLGDAHRSTTRSDTLDVTCANGEVRAALAGRTSHDAVTVDPELARYAQFRGAQERLGRNWRDWPTEARCGRLTSNDVDADEARFHLVAQTEARRQLQDLRHRFGANGFRLGLDLAVGVHPEGYDPWSRQELFVDAMSVGAPPDAGFPSGQDWGFAPLLPSASRLEGHRYIAASIAHQASLAGVLRVDHIMAWSRLYWIPRGLDLHQGTYVSHPAEELFAVLALESARNHCEIVGEDLGTVPPEIDEALPRHRIWSMYLAQFEASNTERLSPPGRDEVALVGTHDTPTFAGWIAGRDIEDRVRYGLLDADAAPWVAEERRQSIGRLAGLLDCVGNSRAEFLNALLDWLGRSESPLVIPWLEDLWLEETAVNLPGTPSSLRPNWQRPMARLIDEIVTDPAVETCLRRLNDARSVAAKAPVASPT